MDTKSPLNPGAVSSTLPIFTISNDREVDLNSTAYDTIRNAMLARQQIICTYQGLHRELCVHTLGHKAGREKMLGLQFAGESSQGLPLEGAWRCLFIDDISDVAVRDGPWHTQDNHSKPQTCVDDVDLEVFG